MKTLIAALLMFVGFSAGASVLEVNKQESKVYFTVTPTLQMTLMDLDSDGGMLTIFLDYSGSNVKSELQILRQQYPNYAIQAVIARPESGTVDFEIADVGLKKTFRVSQGQTGPYLNTQILLTSGQVKRLTELRGALKDKVAFQLPIHSSYFSQQVLESVTLDESACGGDKVKSIKDVIANLANFRRPAGIKNEQTFSSLKNDILDKCYGIAVTQINSFAELMKLSVAPAHPTSLSGVYVDSVKREKSDILSVNYDLQLN